MRLLLILVFSALLCSCVFVLGVEGDVSGPELVWKLYEPEPTYEALSIVGSGNGGFIVVASRKEEAEPYHDDRIRHQVVLFLIASAHLDLREPSPQVWSADFGEKPIAPRLPKRPFEFSKDRRL